jgi:ferredoxin-NADP reductase
MTTTLTLTPSSTASVPEHLLSVGGRRELADGVIELTLDSDSPLPSWQPGAHLELEVGDGVRQYSLCGDPRDTGAWTIAVLREPDGRGGSAWVHDTLADGDQVRVRGPRNHFPLEPAPAYRFIAGGIGITPLLPMVQAAEDAGIPWSLLYGGRRRESMAYLPELADYRDKVQVRPEDEYGLLDLAGCRAEAPAGTRVYACGPEPLLAAVEQTFEGMAVHVERFAARPVGEDVIDAEFEVVFDRSGITATVPPGVSILDVASEAGIFVLRSCSEGVCGTCETLVLDGEPDHRDSVYTEDDHAEGAFAPCVSRCRSGRLVLDL